jgi:hypothetical protein
MLIRPGRFRAARRSFAALDHNSNIYVLISHGNAERLEGVRRQFGKGGVRGARPFAGWTFPASQCRIQVFPCTFPIQLDPEMPSGVGGHSRVNGEVAGESRARDMASFTT